jgi:predicted dehydrogenase
MATSKLASITAVADDLPEAARSVAGPLDAKCFQSHSELLEQDGLDAIIVCTPPATHFDIVTAALEHGKHVMCEKPFALATGEARQLIATANKHGLTLTMASKFRYVADVVAARRLVNEGLIGDPVLVENTFASRVPMAGRWNSRRTISGGGVLIDNGTHSVDIVRYLVGPIHEVFAVEGRRAQDLEVEDTVGVFARCDGDIRATIDLSWTINKERDSYLEIYGSEGAILVGWGGSRYLTETGEGWTPFGLGYDKGQAMRDQVHNFCRAITHGETLLITTQDALASVEVVAAAYASMFRNNWVSLDSVRSSLSQVS